MTVVMTMMVRDEADIIAATIEHHLAQGIDRILVTDNASTDGTREILAEYAAIAPVTVFDDPEHRKQQAQVVTRMARLAFEEHGADWVLNGDADEFVRAVDPSLTVAEALERTPKEIGAFTVPVVNLVGAMARRGSGLRRLVLRDERTIEALRAAGVHAHPTPNAIHVGSPDVEVAHGNHFVSIEQRGEPPAEAALEVLHLPWRSSGQFERKTENMGRAYEQNPDLRPSANHHGMRDWRRMRAGVLLPFLARRMPVAEELDVPGFREDRSLVESLERLEPLLPARLAAVLDDSADAPFTTAEIQEQRALAELLAPLDQVAQDDIVALRDELDARNTELFQLRLERETIDAIPGVAARIAAEREDAWHAGLDAATPARLALEGQLADAREQAARAGAERDGVASQLQQLRAHPAIRAAAAVKRAARLVRR
ncbi:glycosyltransferase family 2 protein [Agrococcus sp. DT81.2]|uniref:glycosyltransferase family 2 protein n=1 Tax=Agrococcus sp. DT81.2 TaxID=3393414 RepID=UPI003CE4A3B6